MDPSSINTPPGAQPAAPTSTKASGFVVRFGHPLGPTQVTDLADARLDEHRLVREIRLERSYEAQESEASAKLAVQGSLRSYRSIPRALIAYEFMTQAALHADFLEFIEMFVNADRRQLNEQKDGVKVKALPGIPIDLTPNETVAQDCKLFERWIFNHRGLTEFNDLNFSHT